MELAAEILFWIGTAFLLIEFGCAVAMNFVKGKAYKVLHWIVVGCTCVAFVCYVVHKALIGDISL